MSFDYNKTSRSHGNSDSFWTSYSDLFLGLSTIFLLLYVTASLRTGTDAIKAQVDNRKLTMEVEELKSQLAMYENVKNNYMEKNASQDEQQEYQELMDKLTLLQEDAKDDSDRLAKEALENERKAAALNKYQQMVRNMINANKMAKMKVIARNDIIDEQDSTISEQKKDIDTLETDVAQKKAMIEQNQKQISTARATLAKRKKELLAAYKANEMTKQAYEEKAKQIQTQGDEKIKKLVDVNHRYSAQLNQLSNELKGTQAALDGSQAALAGTREALNQKDEEARDLQGKLHASEGEAQGLRAKIAGLKAGYEKEMGDARAALDAEIRKGKMGQAERARREGELKARAAAKERELAGKIGALQGQLKDTTGQLAKAKEEIDARRGIAREIQKGFAAAGIKADVDMQTGEVVLDFGDHYFESDSANLNADMKNIIERAMPIYSKSLFGNPKISDKISTVEIVGFASPTYKGKFVDPRSDKYEDKVALKYNMDLSYRRANSIFNYLLENKGNEFAHQKNLLGLMKVSGRSFLEVMKVKNRGPASAAEFCKVNDCKKAQRVIVRFSMDGKK
jgi:outer membrane protein OmpA-like peptidoglycan-associated protein